MDKKSAFEKIKKCLALSKSANEHEAAAALRQAQLLMEKFGIDEDDMLMHEIHEANAKAGAKIKPALWESQLSSLVGQAFGCRVYFRNGFRHGLWIMVGTGASAEVGTYALTVLLRQIKRCRAEFIADNCKRLKAVNKTRRADLFCEGWVFAVSQTVSKFANTEQQEQGLAAYIERHFKKSASLKSNDRKGKKTSYEDLSAFDKGMDAGQQVTLNRPVTGATGQQRLLGGMH